MSQNSNSTRPASTAKILLIGLAFIFLTPLVIEHLRAAWTSQTLAELCERDMTQDYAVARAVLSGRDPYRPLPELVNDEVSECRGRSSIPFAHASPHPLFMALLSHPLAKVLTLEESYHLNFCLQLLYLFAACAALGGCSGITKTAFPGLYLGLLTLASFRSFDTLFHGQANFLLLAAFATSALALKRSASISAGISFGLAVAIKYAGWPIFLFLILKRQWKILAASLATFCAFQLLTLALLGREVFLRFYQIILPEVGSKYLGCGINESLWTLSRHLFQGFATSCFAVVNDGSIVPALFPATGNQEIIQVALPLLVIVLFLVGAWRSLSLERGFLVLACLSPVVSPIFWGHAAVQTFLIFAILPQGTLSIRRYPLFSLLVVLWFGGMFVFPQLLAAISVNSPLMAAIRNILGMATVMLATWAILIAPHDKTEEAV